GSDNSTIENPTHVYSSAGNYTVTLMVTDGNGDCDIEENIEYISVDADLTPSAEFIADHTSIVVGQQVAFTFTGSRGNLPVEFQWDFGDGSENSGLENPTHVYSSAGSYTVTLMVTDGNGDYSINTKIISVITLVPSGSLMAPLMGGQVAFLAAGIVAAGGISTFLIKKWRVGEKKRALGKIQPT
ncbi:MAG: PKD domain-containing protein, partial [Promethearchaeota archaeon]